MNIKQAVELTTAKLSANSDSANLDARILACYACGISQTKLITEPGRELSNENESNLTAYIERRAKGEPLAYIIGKKEFWSLDFIVNPHVLIPRPETELLVELTLEAISTIETPRILELGTGSGAIAISIAKERSDCLITATDISKPALEVAKVNAEKHNAEIILIQSNWYEHLTVGQSDKKYHAIVCNPPYIANNDSNIAPHVALHEPNSALFSKKNGLQDLETVISNAKTYLAAKGALLVEHGFQQANYVKEQFTNANYSNICTHKDLAGHPRCTTANK